VLFPMLRINGRSSLLVLLLLLLLLVLLLLLLLLVLLVLLICLLLLLICLLLLLVLLILLLLLEFFPPFPEISFTFIVTPVIAFGFCPVACRSLLFEFYIIEGVDFGKTRRMISDTSSKTKGCIKIRMTQASGEHNDCDDEA